MGLTKLRRRRIRANYSHSEPVIHEDRDREGRTTTTTLHVANRDMRGDGRCFAVRSLPKPVEVERAKRPKRERREAEEG